MVSQLVFNNFINDVELLNHKLKDTEDYFIIKKIFSKDIGKRVYRKKLKF